TLTDVTFSFDYSASFPCSMPDGGVSFDYGACRSPAFSAYTCSTGGTGTCSFTNYSLYNDIQSCIPAPQCNAYLMNFSMNLFRCHTDSVTPGCSSTCISAASTWSITVSGHT